MVKQKKLQPEEIKELWKLAIEAYGSDKCDICGKKANNFYMIDGEILGMACKTDDKTIMKKLTNDE